MALSSFRKFLRRRLQSGQQLQQEIDTHRLLLLTMFFEEGAGASGASAERVVHEVEKMDHEEQRRALAELVDAQVLQLGSTVHNIVDGRAKHGPASHRLAATGASDLASSGIASSTSGTPMAPPSSPQCAPLTKADVADAFQVQEGFTLGVQESGVGHEDAGQGLFLRGSARAGAVVAFYPGVAYRRHQHKYVPGFPRVAQENPYLIARYDGLILDARPWGLGGEEQALWSGLLPQDLAWLDKRAVSQAQHEGRPSDQAERAQDNDSGATNADATSNWTSVLSSSYWTPAAIQQRMSSRIAPKDWMAELGGNEAAAAATATMIERRHPLALAHWANHPGATTAGPNVRLCPYDFPLTTVARQALRPYVPVLQFLAGSRAPSSAAPRGAEESKHWTTLGSRQQPWGANSRAGRELLADDQDDDTDWALEGRQAKDHIGMLLFVATRDLQDEEIFLDYRLSPHVPRPAWYQSVDPEEEARRWDL